MLILIKKKREHAKTELQSLENTSRREPREYALKDPVDSDSREAEDKAEGGSV